MSDEIHGTPSDDSDAAIGVETAVVYAASKRTRYVLIAAIVVLAFGLSYGIAQGRSGQDSQAVAENGTMGLATTAGAAQSAGGG